MAKSVSSKRNSKNLVRLILSLVSFAGLCFAFYVFLVNSLESRDKYSLSYKETSNINYSVCLKENNFYEEECLQKDMKYVASLIDKIHLNMKYSFNTDSEVYSAYNYSVIGKIIISDPVDNKVLFTKNYELLKDTLDNSNNTKEHIINQLVDIDYEKYNSLASKFKSTYGVTSNARLEVHLIIRNEGYSGLSEELKYARNPDLYVSIPLTENSVNVTIDSALLDNSDTVTYQTKFVIGNYFLFGSAILSLVIGLYIIADLILFLHKTYNSKSEYEKTINKLLREYDRLIVESPTIINTDDYNVIIVQNFEELLDVHDNLKLPIIFNEIIKKRESWLYIKNNGDLYLFVLSLESKGE